MYFIYIFAKLISCYTSFKAFCQVPGVSPLYELEKFGPRGRHSIHTTRWLNRFEEPVNPEEPTGHTEGSADGKTKRIKLKGKRAVVKWLKFFRFKKKKEYERMTAEEKILYKLRKVIFIYKFFLLRIKSKQYIGDFLYVTTWPLLAVF